MSICPICNGMSKIKVACEECQEELVDFGRIMDYDEKYHPYEEIDLLKEKNGIANDLQQHLCPHYVTCPNCNSFSVYLVQEQ